MFDLKAIALAEWQQFKQSKVLKLALVFILTSLTGLVCEALQGQIKTLGDLKFYAMVQGIGLLAIFFRHTAAGIEAKLDLFLGHEGVVALEKAMQQKAVEALKEKHPEAATALQAEFEKKA